MQAPPKADEIEVTLLGRGYGECIVIHAGDDEWIVIDSFLSEGRPAALTYLERLGVGPDRIKLILATHWHDDHIGGLAELYRLSTSADIAFSLAMQHDEFANFLAAYGDEARPDSKRGAAELGALIDVAVEDKRRPPMFAASGGIVFERTSAGRSLPTHVTLRALSPSNQDIVNFLRALAAPHSDHGRRLDGRHRNGSSVAAWLSIGDVCVLLGADLECDRNPLCGWQAVVDSPVRPAGQASLVKVAHHGSVTGHNDDVWRHMIMPTPISALAPWNRSSMLPTAADVGRLKQQSSALYSAMGAPERRFRPLLNVVSKMVAAGGGEMVSTPRNFGHVTARLAAAQQQWHLTIGDGAELL